LELSGRSVILRGQALSLWVVHGTLSLSGCLRQIHKQLELEPKGSGLITHLPKTGWLP
jgi:hypothetical protein